MSLNPVAVPGFDFKTAYDIAKGAVDLAQKVFGGDDPQLTKKQREAARGLGLEVSNAGRTIREPDGDKISVKKAKKIIKAGVPINAPAGWYGPGSPNVPVAPGKQVVPVPEVISAPRGPTPAPPPEYIPPRYPGIEAPIPPPGIAGPVAGVVGVLYPTPTASDDVFTDAEYAARVAEQRGAGARPQPVMTRAEAEAFWRDIATDAGDEPPAPQQVIVREIIREVPARAPRDERLEDVRITARRIPEPRLEPIVITASPLPLPKIPKVRPWYADIFDFGRGQLLEQLKKGLPKVGGKKKKKKKKPVQPQLPVTDVPIFGPAPVVNVPEFPALPDYPAFPQPAPSSSTSTQYFESSQYYPAPADSIINLFFPEAYAAPTFDPLTAVEAAGVGYSQPYPLQLASAGCPPCSCDEKKKRKRKKQPRAVCYRGTYTETATGLNKRKGKKVPCRP